MARLYAVSTVSLGAAPSGRPEPSGLLVVAYGNELRRDDGAGPRVGRALMRRPLPGFSVMVRHQLTPEIAEPLSQASHALFVDVRVPDGDSAVCLDRLDAAADAGPVGHAMHPADLLALAQALYGHAPDAWILSLPSEDLGLGDQISSRAAQGVRRGVLAARRLADRLGYGVET